MVISAGLVTRPFGTCVLLLYDCPANRCACPARAWA
jgi:hypothetical protein